MKASEADVRAIVEQVLRRIGAEAPATGARVTPPGTGSDGVFDRMEDAIDAAEAAQRALVALPMAKRYEIVAAMRRTIIDHAEELSRAAVEETGMGRVEDKIQKNLLVATKTPGPEDVEPRAFSGSHGLTLEELAPYGVIGSITPSTNSTETFTHNGISMVSAGNSVVFNPHPAAKRVSQRALTLLNRAVLSAGGPPNLLTTVAEPTLKTGDTLFHHPKIRVLVVTGGPAVVEAALATRKRCMAAGPGNPPVVVDLTADLEQAGRDVVRGASFDNNIVCIAEKECFVVGDAARMEAFKAVLRKNHAVELGAHQLDSLLKKAFTDYGGPHDARHCTVSRNHVGRDAAVLAREIGLTVPSSTRLLFSEVESPRHPLVLTEQLMPLLPLVRAPDFETAVSWAVESEHRFRHTAMVHSHDLPNITKYARAIEVSIFVVNGPCYNGLGFEGEGPTTMTITTPTGEGCTTARTFTRRRRLTVAGGALRIL